MTTTHPKDAPASPRLAIIASLTAHRLHLLLLWAIVYQEVGADNELVKRQQRLIDEVTRQIRDLRQQEERATLAARQARTTNVARWEALDATC